MATPNLPKLPNFLIAGPPKGGTTSLHHYLRQHPQVYMNPIKEPQFFAIADLRARDDYAATVARERAPLRAYLDGAQLDPAQYWITEWDDYVRMFRNARDEVAIGEASVNYFWMPSAAATIRSRLPNVRLVFMLRDPMERLFAWYMMALRRGGRVTFREWAERAMSGGPEYGPAVDGGRFGTHLARFLTHFPREQMRIYLYDSLRADTRSVVRDLLAFLGVDPDRPLDVSRVHNPTVVPRFPAVDRLRRQVLGNRSLTSWLPGPWHQALKRLYNRRRIDFTIDPADRRMVIDYYRDEILHAADLIGRDLSGWLR